jgi:hypothetical protein
VAFLQVLTNSRKAQTLISKVVDLYARIHLAERRGLDLMTDFVMTELELGRTFCQLSKNYQNVERSNRAIKNAWKALESAEKYMWRLRM